MRHKLCDSLKIDVHLADVKHAQPASKRIGFLVHLPNSSAASFDEISLRNHAKGCSVQTVPFMTGVWVARPYHHQRIEHTLVQAIKRDLIAQGFKELCSKAHLENTRSHLAHGTLDLGI